MIKKGFNNLPSALSAEYPNLSRKQRILFYVLAASGAMILYLFFLSAVNYSVDFSIDEPFYLSTCERILKGDKFIVHDWLLPQFVALFQILPYSIFKAINGSSEGAILFMRYFAMGASFFNYLYIIAKLKQKPWLALISAFSFCNFIPLGALFIGYYTLPPTLLFAVALIVTDEKAKHRSLRLVFAGILFSAAVILVPLLSISWIIYCVFAFARFLTKRNNRPLFSDYDFALDAKTFKSLLLGVLISAAAMLALLSACGIKDVVNSLPNLMVHVDETESGLFYALSRMQLLSFLRSNAVPSCLMAAETTAVIIFRAALINSRKSQKYQAVLLLLNCLLLAFSLIFGFVGSIRNGIAVIVMFPPIFVAWFGLNCCLLGEKIETKNIFIWLMGAALSFAQDITSQISCAFGSIICVYPTVNSLIQLCREINSKKAGEKPHSKRKTSDQGKTFFACFASVALLLGMISIFAWSAGNVVRYNKRLRIEPKAEGQAMIETGPYKGIWMPNRYKNLHDDIIKDLDLAMNMTDGSIYIMGNYPFAYLYMDRNVPCASTFSALEELNEKYWSIFPERKPEAVYIPFDTTGDEIILSKEDFDKMPKKGRSDFSLFSGSATKGKAGLILKIEEWK